MPKEYMPKPCAHCPYRHDVRPFLTNERAEELAYLAHNLYNYFWCHETTEEDEYSEEGDCVAVDTSKICAGFLTLQHNENGRTWYDDEGFKPAVDVVYGCAEDMIAAYEYENEKESA